MKEKVMFLILGVIIGAAIQGYHYYNKDWTYSSSEEQAYDEGHENGFADGREYGYNEAQPKLDSIYGERITALLGDVDASLYILEGYVSTSSIKLMLKNHKCEDDVDCNIKAYSIQELLNPASDAECFMRTHLEHPNWSYEKTEEYVFSAMRK